MCEVQRDRRMKVLDLLLNALVSRVNRRIDMRMFKFCRSTWLVEI